MIHDPWSMIHDPWSMIHDPWYLIVDPWSMILDPWSMMRSLCSADVTLVRVRSGPAVRFRSVRFRSVPLSPKKNKKVIDPVKFTDSVKLYRSAEIQISVKKSYKIIKTYTQMLFPWIYELMAKHHVLIFQTLLTRSHRDRNLLDLLEILLSALGKKCLYDADLYLFWRSWGSSGSPGRYTFVIKVYRSVCLTCLSINKWYIQIV